MARMRRGRSGFPFGSTTVPTPRDGLAPGGIARQARLSVRGKCRHHGWARMSSLLMLVCPTSLGPTILAQPAPKSATCRIARNFACQSTRRQAKQTSTRPSTGNATATRPLRDGSSQAVPALSPSTRRSKAVTSHRTPKVTAPALPGRRLPSLRRRLNRRPNRQAVRSRTATRSCRLSEPRHAPRPQRGPAGRATAR